MHKKAGSNTRDAAPRPTKAATAVAAAMMDDFDEQFSLTGDEAHCAAIIHRHQERLRVQLSDATTTDDVRIARARIATYTGHVNVLGKLKSVSEREPWWSEDDQLTDFISTLAARGSDERVAFKLMPTDSVKHVYKPGEMVDAPHMTKHHALKFSIKEAKMLDEPFSVSVMPRESVVRHTDGTAIYHGGVLVAGRCRRQLSPAIVDELLVLYRHLDRLRPYLQRGKAVANVCSNFVATGFKCDQNTRQCLIHQPNLPTPKTPEPSSQTVAQTRQQWNKLSGLYNRHIHPIVMDSFGAIFEPVLHWMELHGLRLYAKQITGVTFGEQFWPLSHIDPDAWYTALVPVDVGRGPVDGGDFAFARAGWVLKCEPGDVLIYNGCELHGTTEFAFESADDSRIFLAFYVSKKVVEARRVTDSMPTKPHVDYGYL